MTPQELKNSILQLAIQGKLVEYNEEKNDVDIALQIMQTKRIRLIAEKKLKNEGKINKTSDVEIDIPDHWRLVPLKDLICKRVDNRGKTPPHHYNGKQGYSLYRH